MIKEISIPVVTRLNDNGDGGYTIYIYNNEDEMIADHPSLEDLEEDEYEAKKEEILSGDNEYENGYLDSGTIGIKQNKDGSFSLSKKLSFHAGQ